MKLLVSLTLLTATVLISSLANGKENTTISVVQPQTVTLSALGHAKHRRIVKSKVQRAILFGLDDDNDDVVQNDDLQTGYRRRDLNKIEHTDSELNDYIKIRLMLARMKAMKAYSIASLSK
jgi:hypothetical protein